MQHLFAYFKSLEEQGIILSYKGQFTDVAIGMLVSFLEVKLKELSTTTKVRRRILNIVVESLQNVYHHQSTDPKEHEPCFVLAQDQDQFHVYTGNLVHANLVEDLRDHMEHIKAQDPEGLRTLYRKTLSQKKPLEEKTSGTGAGIGMIDIARRARNAFSYSIQHIEGKHFFFGLDISVDKAV